MYISATNLIITIAKLSTNLCFVLDTLRAERTRVRYYSTSFLNLTSNSKKGFLKMLHFDSRHPIVTSGFRVFHAPPHHTLQAFVNLNGRKKSSIKVRDIFTGN